VTRSESPATGHPHPSISRDNTGATSGPFSGEVAGFYARFRRGYPGEILDAVIDLTALRANDIVLDLGCGTGQLTLPLARRVRVAVGMDPEPDMLALARRAAAEAGVANAVWVLGSDNDVSALGPLFEGRMLGALTVGQALHWMDHDRLFDTVGPMLRPGGGIAVISNGSPLWLQTSAPSQALRRFLEGWWNMPVGDDPCGTDAEARRRYTDALERLGFEVSEVVTEYRETLDLESIVGSMYSAMSPNKLPSTQERDAFATQLGAALPADEPFVENVRVVALIGRR
jgi:ubiquinone/menaquinone biosynthesis C-methylase UbiE